MRKGRRPSPGWHRPDGGRLHEGDSLCPRDGHSNSEIGTGMFISSHAVAYHLRKVFCKLGIHNRAQLVRARAKQADTAEFS